jgi:molybdate transport system substrate-binding protein
VHVYFAALLLAAWLVPPERPAPAPVLVSAAISLTDALLEIETEYRRTGGGPVRFNFAGSNVLARQIANGAPADIFISADLVQMQYAENAGAVARGASFNLLSNALAVVTAQGRSTVRVARDLTQPAVKRIAIGDPAAVPAGFYAKQYLERAGLWAALQSKLLSLANVRAALAAVENGGADAAIVYHSDAATSTRSVLAFVVPDGEAPAIVYPAAIVAATKNRAAAERFLAFLRGPDARRIFERFKFRPYSGIQ